MLGTLLLRSEAISLGARLLGSELLALAPQRFRLDETLLPNLLLGSESLALALRLALEDTQFLGSQDFFNGQCCCVQNRLQ